MNIRAMRHTDDHEQGLQADLLMIERRKALAWFAAGAAIVAAGPARAKAGSSGACVANPRETAGPFPADGSNRAQGTVANALIESGVVRADMRSSFGAFTGRAEGVPLNLKIRLADAADDCAPLAGHAVYLWHCDAAGRYSIYNLPTENYLRGVGVTDAAGEVSFVTTFPGCYGGRYPHIHFEVFKSLEHAADYRNRVLVSQFALPEDACASVYQADKAYAQSLTPFSRTSIARDGIFRNNRPEEVAAQTIRVSGDVSRGYDGEVTVGLLI